MYFHSDILLNVIRQYSFFFVVLFFAWKYSTSSRTTSRLIKINEDFVVRKSYTHVSQRLLIIRDVSFAKIWAFFFLSEWCNEGIWLYRLLNLYSNFTRFTIIEAESIVFSGNAEDVSNEFYSLARLASHLQ